MRGRSFELSGPDGTNPLGFLASVGILVALHHGGLTGARLGWRRARTWSPVLEGVLAENEEDLAATLAAALRGRPILPDAEARRAAAQRELERAGTRLKKKREEIRRRGLARAERREAEERELRPLEEDFREKRARWLQALREAVPRPELALGKRIDCTPEEYREHAAAMLTDAGLSARDALDLLAAFGSDACRAERSEAIEATPFCFTFGSGHQFFLATVRELSDEVTPERVRQTLFHPWTYRDQGRSLRWDPGEDRRYALLDRDPTANDNKPRTEWMANLLAYRALALFPTAPEGHSLGATGWTASGGPFAFTWPLWEFAADPDTVRTLLQLRELVQEHPDMEVLRARGISAVFRTWRLEVGKGIQRKLNFGPARQI